MKNKTENKRNPIAISTKFRRWLIRTFHLKDELSAEIIATIQPKIISEINEYDLLAERLGMTKEKTVTELLWNDSPPDYPELCEPVEITTTIYVRNGERYVKTMFGYVHAIRYDLNVKLRKLAHKFQILLDDYRILEYKNEKLQKKVALLEKQNQDLQTKLDAHKIKAIESQPQKLDAAHVLIVHHSSSELRQAKRLLTLSQQNCADLEGKLIHLQNNAADNISRKRCSDLIGILNSNKCPETIVAEAQKYLLHKEDCAEKKKKRRRKEYKEYKNY